MGGMLTRRLDVWREGLEVGKQGRQGGKNPWVERRTVKESDGRPTGLADDRPATLPAALRPCCTSQAAPAAEASLDPCAQCPTSRRCGRLGHEGGRGSAQAPPYNRADGQDNGVPPSAKALSSTSLPTPPSPSSPAPPSSSPSSPPAVPLRGLGLPVGIHAGRSRANAAETGALEGMLMDRMFWRLRISKTQAVPSSEPVPGGGVGAYCG